MIDRATVGDIIAQYKKHGWTPRRALLSDANKNLLLESLEEMEVEFSDIDALWFSRRSSPDSEAWELRRMTGTPFALIAIIPSEMSPDEMEATLEQVADE